jgi:hypothetical protein
MKKSLIVILVLISLSVVSQVKEKPVRLYRLEYSEISWASKVQILMNVQEIMRKSTLPANVVAQWTDSVQSIIADIQKQVGQQMAADTTKKK